MLQARRKKNNCNNVSIIEDMRHDKLHHVERPSAIRLYEGEGDEQELLAVTSYNAILWLDKQ